MKSLFGKICSFLLCDLLKEAFVLEESNYQDPESIDFEFFPFIKSMKLKNWLIFLGHRFFSIWNDIYFSFSCREYLGKQLEKEQSTTTTKPAGAKA